MSWNQILNHEPALERFRRSVGRNRLASTYLFVGPPGIGKHTFALKLAETLLCESRTNDEFEPCGICQGCMQVQSQSHPDLILVSKPDDKAFIPLETFIGDKEHRRQEGLCHDIGLKPFRGGRKIAIIDDADFLNQEGANSLLKTLEEPPPQSLLILIGTSEQRQLATIVSRSQVVRFAPLNHSQVLTVLQQQSLEIDDALSLPDLANASEGSVDLAIKLADSETIDFRHFLFDQLSSLDPGKDDFAKTVIGFVDSAGKEAAKKRTRLVMIGDFAISFYRQWVLRLSGVEPDPERTDPSLREKAEASIGRWRNDINRGTDVAAQCIERCTEMQRQVVFNASAANVVESWLRDLGRICRGEFVTAI
jgi:DNA polymerase-3 subunit delta'